MNTQIATEGSSPLPTTAAVGTDNLTSQIAGMSKHQLYQIVSQMKDLIQQNQQQARQILIDNLQLTKTLFQAQIMLGMVRAPDCLPPVALAPAQPPATMAPVQHSQQSPAQTPALQVPSTPLPQPISTFQPLSSPQAASQQLLPQMASPYLQQSQTASVSLQANRPSFSFQQSVQTPSHSLPAALQPPMQQALCQPPLPSHPPPLPQQPHLLASPSQQQNTQGMGFTPSPVPQSYHPQRSYMQQGGPSPQQTNAGPSFQQMHAPPLPNQPPPQHMFQVPRDMGGNTSIASGGMLPVTAIGESGRGLNMGVPSTSAPSLTWNQALPLTGSVGVPQVTPTGLMVAGQSPLLGAVGLTSSMAPGPGQMQVFNQPLTQSQLSQQPQHQPQMQLPIELEQQKALLQQVMNLTPEQINSLPPEQRQQVLQLQQAFRSQTG